MTGQPAALIVFSGLPGVGKTAIARELAKRNGAVYLRIDSIEQALEQAGAPQLDDAGYRAAYAIAEDNLRLGRTVVADCVNPVALTREAWAEVANKVSVPAFNIVVSCASVQEHRRRVEERVAGIPGLRLPGWREVAAREYEPWERDHIPVDTSGRTVEESVRTVEELLARS